MTFVKKDKKPDGRKDNLKNFGGIVSKGRPKGSKNIISKGVKDDMLNVYNRLDGANGLYKWCKRNPSNLSMFYRMMISLLPKDIHIDHNVTHSLSKLSDDDLIAIIKRGSILSDTIIDIENKEDKRMLIESGFHNSLCRDGSK